MTAFEPIDAQLATSRAGFSQHRLFLLVAPLLYLAYALLTPPFQTPDEHQHLFRAWQLSEFQLRGERRGDASGGVLPAALGQAALPQVGSLEPHASYRPVVQRSFAKNFATGTPLQTNTAPRFYDFRGAVIYSPAGYVPQVLAVWTGKLAHLSIENIVRLGRLLNAAVAVSLIYWALRLAPVGRSAILFIGLLPMTVAASAAFGQDGLVIGGSCLLTALGLRMALNDGASRPEVLFSGLIAILLTLSKVFYLPLAMIGGQPFVGNRIRLRKLWPSLAICLVAAALTALWLEVNSGAVVPPWPQIPPAGQRLASWLHHPAEFPGILERTYFGGAPKLVGSLFMFGWLNVPANSAAVFLTLIALGLLFMAGDPLASRLGWQMRLWMAASAVTVPLLLSFIAWLYWTPVSMDSIPGLQGRYFIPIAPALLVAVLPRRRTPTSFGKLVPLLMVGANIVALMSLVGAFYDL